MEDLLNDIKELQLALQTLVKRHNFLKRENEHLKELNAEIKSQLLEKEKLIETSQEKLATTNFIEYNEESKQLLQEKIDAYLKDIEKCLTLLNA